MTHTVKGSAEITIVYNNKPILGKIEQLEVFDMDHDAIDDIIVMDSIGNLYIFYGNKTGVFTVQFIENVYDFTL